MSNLSLFFAKFIFLRNNFLNFFGQIFVQSWIFASIFEKFLQFLQRILRQTVKFNQLLNSKKTSKSDSKITKATKKTKSISRLSRLNRLNIFYKFWPQSLILQDKLRLIISIFCQIILVFGMTFGVLTSLPVHAEDGVIGFSDCKFGSAEEIRKKGEAGAAPGNETFRKCLQQILTFIFVLGVFLIGIRIAIEAFKSLNPVISGNSINNSVKLGQDIVIGLILIGAPSIFLGLFNEAALQLPNLFELAQYRPGNEKAKTSTTGTGTTGTSPTGGTGTADGTSGSGGAGTAKETDLTVGGKKVSKEDLDEAIQRRIDKKTLTDSQTKILEEYDKKLSTTSGSSDTIWISKDLQKVNKDEVIKALAEAQKKPTEGGNQLVQDGIKYAQGLGKSCLSSSFNPDRSSSDRSSDATACGLLQSSRIQLSALEYQMNYPSGQSFVLPSGWSRTGTYAPTNGSKDTHYQLDFINGSRKIKAVFSCPTAAIAKQSPLTQANFTNNAELNVPGCEINARFMQL